VHSHRQRLARWLLTTTDKARQPWLAITHEALAQLVGGPRHAVTVAVNELRAKGAIVHLRGRIDVFDRSALIAQACECYAIPALSDLR
jgi:CRP-like cAMP-binding protein